MKKLNILIFILTVSHITVISQIITFSGKNTKTGANVQLDSVRIINLTHPKDTIIKNNFSLDLSIFTGVDNTTSGNPIPFSLEQNYPNSFENETKFEICIPQASTVTLYLQNSLGEIITSFSNYLSEGKHQFQLDGSGLAIGPYFISAMANGERKAIKIMKIGNSSGDKVEIKYVGGGLNPGMILILGDVFDFIGFAKGRKRDTIKSVVPKGGEKYEFAFEILSDWNFSSMVLEIGGFKADYTYSMHYIYFDGSKYDTIQNRTIDFQQKYTLTENDTLKYPCVGLCGNYSSYRDTIKFCNCICPYSYSCNWIKFGCIIDSNRKQLTQFIYEDISHTELYESVNHIKYDIDFRIRFNDLDYSLDNNGNLYVNINKDVNKKLEELFYSYYHYDERGSNFGKEYDNLISYYGFSDESYIRITLKP